MSELTNWIEKTIGEDTTIRGTISSRYNFCQLLKGVLDSFSFEEPRPDFRSPFPENKCRFRAGLDLLYFRIKMSLLVRAMIPTVAETNMVEDPNLLKEYRGLRK